MSRVLVLQHTECETLGIIADALAANGVSHQYVRTFAGEPVPPDLDQFAGLVVMGGPMGVYEQYAFPFLVDEMRLIERALTSSLPVLGVCLGSELLAAALGAEVRKGKQKEIGWHKIELTEARREDPLWAGIQPSFMGFHWHGDVFDLPVGAVSLASSEITSCQAFRYGAGAYGFLFHMEATAEIVEGMVAAFEEELRGERIDGGRIITESGEYLPHLRRVGSTVFGRWASLITG